MAHRFPPLPLQALGAWIWLPEGTRRRPGVRTDGRRGRRGSARGPARSGCEPEGRLYRAWVGGDPAGVEPGAGSRSDDAGRSELCVRGLGELEGRPRGGCCCYWAYRGLCGGRRSFKVSGSSPHRVGRGTVGMEVQKSPGIPRARRTGPGEGLGKSPQELPRDFHL